MEAPTRIIRRFPIPASALKQEFSIQVPWCARVVHVKYDVAKDAHLEAHYQLNIWIEANPDVEDDGFDVMTFRLVMDEERYDSSEWELVASLGQHYASHLLKKIRKIK